MKLNLAIFLILLAALCSAQVPNSGMVEQMDSTQMGKVTFSGLVDTYYGYDFNEPPGSDRPYFVSSARHNEINVNLVYLGISYRNDKIRARFFPGFGTYVNANYVGEKGSLRNLIEANAGVCLSEKKSVWLDAGVFGSPYTNESAISRDHLMYTRSFAPEYVPYYLTGAKLSAPLGKKWVGYLYILNGWQNITDTNNSLSLGTQLEFRPGKKLLLNFNTYIGDESSSSNPTFGMRYFADFYLIYNPEGKLSLTASTYIGKQQILQTNTSENSTWWQVNCIGRIQLNKRLSLSGRLEYFHDPNQIMIRSLTTQPGFKVASGGLCLNRKINSNALLRLEYRGFWSESRVFFFKKLESNFSNQLIGNLTVWF